MAKGQKLTESEQEQLEDRLSSNGETAKAAMWVAKGLAAAIIAGIGATLAGYNPFT